MQLVNFLWIGLLTIPQAFALDVCTGKNFGYKSADPANPTAYYLCLGLIGKIRNTCPEGFHFNQTAEHCAKDIVAEGAGSKNEFNINQNITLNRPIIFNIFNYLWNKPSKPPAPLPLPKPTSTTSKDLLSTIIQSSISTDISTESFNSTSDDSSLTSEVTESLESSTESSSSSSDDSSSTSEVTESLESSTESSSSSSDDSSSTSEVTDSLESSTESSSSSSDDSSSTSEVTESLESSTESSSSSSDDSSSTSEVTESLESSTESSSSSSDDSSSTSEVTESLESSTESSSSSSDDSSSTSEVTESLESSTESSSSEDLSSTESLEISAFGISPYNLNLIKQVLLQIGSTYEKDNANSKNLLKEEPTIGAVKESYSNSISKTEELCSLLPNGAYFRDPTSCNKYYVCANGKAISRNCPKNLYFDIKTKVCNFAQLVDCSEILDPSLSLISENSFPKVGSSIAISSLSSALAMTKPLESSRPSSSSSSSTLKVSEPSKSTSFGASSNKLKPNGPILLQTGSSAKKLNDISKNSLKTNPIIGAVNIPHKPSTSIIESTDASFFNSFIEDSEVFGLSSEELPYGSEDTDENSGTDTEYDADFTLSLSTIAPPSTDLVENEENSKCSFLPNGSYLRSPSSCSKYIICANGRAITRSCPGTLYFDIEKKVCNFPDLVKCEIDNDKNRNSIKSSSLPKKAAKSNSIVKIPSPEVLSSLPVVTDKLPGSNTKNPATSSNVISQSASGSYEPLKGIVNKVIATTERTSARTTRANTTRAPKSTTASYNKSPESNSKVISQIGFSEPLKGTSDKVIAITGAFTRLTTGAPSTRDPRSTTASYTKSPKSNSKVISQIGFSEPLKGTSDKVIAITGAFTRLTTGAPSTRDPRSTTASYTKSPESNSKVISQIGFSEPLKATNDKVIAITGAYTRVTTGAPSTRDPRSTTANYIKSPESNLKVISPSGFSEPLKGTNDKVITITGAFTRLTTGAPSTRDPRSTTASYTKSPESNSKVISQIGFSEPLKGTNDKVIAITGAYTRVTTGAPSTRDPRSTTANYIKSPESNLKVISPSGFSEPLKGTNDKVITITGAFTRVTTGAPSTRDPRSTTASFIKSPESNSKIISRSGFSEPLKGTINKVIAITGAYTRVTTGAPFTRDPRSTTASYTKSPESNSKVISPSGFSEPLKGTNDKVIAITGPYTRVTTGAPFTRDPRSTTASYTKSSDSNSKVISPSGFSEPLKGTNDKVIAITGAYTRVTTLAPSRDPRSTTVSYTKSPDSNSKDLSKSPNGSFEPLKGTNNKDIATTRAYTVTVTFAPSTGNPKSTTASFIKSPDFNSNVIKSPSSSYEPSKGIQNVPLKRTNIGVITITRAYTALPTGTIIDNTTGTTFTETTTGTTTGTTTATPTETTTVSSTKNPNSNSKVISKSPSGSFVPSKGIDTYSIKVTNNEVITTTGVPRTTTTRAPKTTTTRAPKTTTTRVPRTTTTKGPKITTTRVPGNTTTKAPKTTTTRAPKTTTTRAPKTTTTKAPKTTTTKAPKTTTTRAPKTTTPRNTTTRSITDSFTTEPAFISKVISQSLSGSYKPSNGILNYPPKGTNNEVITTTRVYTRDSTRATSPRTTTRRSTTTYTRGYSTTTRVYVDTTRSTPRRSTTTSTRGYSSSTTTRVYADTTRSTPRRSTATSTRGYSSSTTTRVYVDTTRSTPRRSTTTSTRGYSSSTTSRVYVDTTRSTPRGSTTTSTRGYSSSTTTRVYADTTRSTPRGSTTTSTRGYGSSTTTRVYVDTTRSTPRGSTTTSTRGYSSSTTRVYDNEVSDCMGLPNGSFLRDSTSCAKFYVCSNGRAIPRKCPGKLYFDIKKMVCNYPSLVDCSYGKIETHITKKPISSSNVNKETNTFTEEPSTFIPDCSSVANGEYLRDPSSCSKFYICANGRALPRQCPKGLYIDIKTKFCDFPSRVECSIDSPENFSSPSTPITDLPDCSDKAEGFIMRDSKMCNKYYACRNGSPVTHFCTPGKWFDLKRQVCEQKRLVECNV